MQQGKTSFDRREFLKHTAVTTASACTFLPEVKGIERKNNSSIKNCIFLLLTGGPSQIDTFDPKPDAQAEIRGPFKAISTKVPGTIFAETLPLLAARADKFTVVRSLFHDEAPKECRLMSPLPPGATIAVCGAKCRTVGMRQCRSKQPT